MEKMINLKLKVDRKYCFDKDIIIKVIEKY